MSYNKEVCDRYRKNNKQKLLIKTQLWRKRNSQRVKEKRKVDYLSKYMNLINYLSNHPCVDCGNSDIRVLEFDHIKGNKVRTVSAMVSGGNSWISILEEIEKCEVRCANCHKIKTAERKNSIKNRFIIERLLN